MLGWRREARLRRPGRPGSRCRRWPRGCGRRDSRFHPGQLAWNRYYRPVDPARLDDGEAISIWSEDGETVGFGWAEAPDWLELQVDPAHPEVAEEIVEWFEEVSDAEQQSALVMEGDVAEQALAAAGFAPERDGPYLRPPRAGSRRPAPVPHVEGYAMRHVETDEAAARAAVHAAAWSDVAPSQVDAQSYAQVMAAWPYRADLDWVVIDAAGELVASALVWLDPATGVGLVEPVGCVPAHRVAGSAGAVTLARCTACARSVARSAQVTPRGDAGYPGPQRLYRSLGFRPTGAHRHLDPLPRVTPRSPSRDQAADQFAVTVAQTAPHAD